MDMAAALGLWFRKGKAIFKKKIYVCNYIPATSCESTTRGTTKLPNLLGITSLQD